MTLKAVYTSNFARCGCHPGGCNQLMTVYAAKYTLMIRSSLSSMLSSVKHILQDVNRKAQNRTCKQLFKTFLSGKFPGKSLATRFNLNLAKKTMMSSYNVFFLKLIRIVIHKKKGFFLFLFSFNFYSSHDVSPLILARRWPRCMVANKQMPNYS